MAVNLRGRSFLKLLDFSPAEIRYLLDLSKNFKDMKRTHTPHKVLELSLIHIYLHMWEEPCISGERGSGTVFFTGCPLRCAFCQNHEIACDRMGWELSAQELSDIFFRLKEKGAANINLVTPGHFAEPVADALKAVSYTHLDVYKRQQLRLFQEADEPFH